MKWTYKLQRLDQIAGSLHSLETAFETIGADGWELVSIQSLILGADTFGGGMTYPIAVFKKATAT
jgi:hypothetical protein